MVRLNLEGIWIDLDNQEFELKWKHPIQNSLKGESSTYSTDITAALTENNREASDYKVFSDSAKTNKYLYGALYVNGTSMRVRAYIKEFSPTSIKFYLEQFRSGGVSNLLKDTTNICDIYLPEIQNKTKQDVLLNVQDGSLYNYSFVPGTNAPNIFHGVFANGRPNIYAENLIQQLALFYGVTLNNAPDNYLVYSNQWKRRTNSLAYTSPVSRNYNTGGSNPRNHDIDLGVSVQTEGIFINGLSITSTSPFKLFINVTSNNSSQPYISFYSKDSLGVYSIIGTSPLRDVSDHFLLESKILPAGVYSIGVFVEAYVQFSISVEAMACYTELEKETAGFSDYADFGLTGLYPCWQNLPKVTAKSMIETIALCSGKMVEYLDNAINFIDFKDIFDWHNAIDVSDKLIGWKTKSFRFLDSNNATVSYADSKVIATVLINDETLPIGTNNVATIDAIRIQDDNGSERVTDKMVLQQTPDGHFEIINKLADIYAPVINPKLFEADFIYFPDNKKPLLIRQLGGIYIALESIMTTKNTITLKLLKLR